MLQIIKTTYRNGVFVPDVTVDLPEGTKTEIVVEKATLDSPQKTDTRKTLLAKLTENMRKNPIPQNAPKKFTRF
ncbi:hypothetical protein BH20ACI1_BH20ACI1_16090 [soil metagenome]